MSRTFSLLFIILGASLLVLPSCLAQEHGPVVLVNITDEIDQTTADTFSNALAYARQQQAQAVVMLLNTPGGGLQQTFAMEAQIRQSPIPVIGYVYPEGATAWSAGTFLLMSSQVAAMANYTVIGSCQPVEIGITGTRLINDSKTINALVSWLQERARMYGRNETLAAEFITTNRNVNATTAYKLGVVEILANSIPALMEDLDGRNVTVSTGVVTLHTKDATVLQYSRPLSLEFYSFLTNPILAALLLMVGIFALLVGLATPGYGAEVFGGILILLGLIGVGFNLSALSIIFIILGMVLILVEIYVTPGFTVVGIGGIICLIIGSIFLIPSYPTREWLITGDYMTTAFLILLLVILVFAVFFGFVLYKVIEIRRKRPTIGLFSGEAAITIDRLTPDKPGYVRYKGEYWLAQSEVDVEPNTKVMILRKEETILHVQPYKSPKN
jgi:membrane-bound serine protease (ClpP class)